jgi:hypothetical protein
MLSLKSLLLSSLLALLALSAAGSPSGPLSNRLQDLTSSLGIERVSLINGTSTAGARSERRWFGPVPPPAPNALWQRYICKGRGLMLQMALSDADVASMLPNPRTSVQSMRGYRTFTPSM